MANYVITRPGFCGYIGTVASGYVIASNASAGQSATVAASAGWLTFGSVRSVTLEHNAEVKTATSNNYNDAVVAAMMSGYSATITLELEESTSSAMKMIFGLSASGITDGSATTPTYYGVTTGPWYIDGSAVWCVATKCFPLTSSTRKIMGGEQELLELKFQVLVDTDASAGKQFLRFFTTA